MIRWARALLVGVMVTVLIGMPVQTGLAQEGPGDLPVTDALLEEYAALIEAEMDFYHVPGAAVAVIQDGEVLFAEGFGVRNVESGEPFTPETQFRIGSTTKSMTSLLIAQLVDEGVLDWDMPVVDLLPEFRTADDDLTPQITLRDLMSMRTGLTPDGLLALDWGAWTVDDLLDAVASMRIDGTFRESYAYNNEVYATAAYAALAGSGADLTPDAYNELIETRLFDPVGMASTLITDALDDLSADFSASYSFNLIDGVSVPDVFLPAPIGVIAPAGAVWSTLEDMSAYVITQMNGGVTPDGTRIVSAESLAETWIPQIDLPANDPDIDSIGYGMGWVSGSYKGVPFRYHDGGWDGYRTQMVIFPETQTGLVIFCNHMLGDMFNNALTFSLAELLSGGDPAPLIEKVRGQFDQQLGGLDAQLALLAPPEVAADEVAPLVGTYEGGWTLELRDDSRLWLVRPYFETVLRPLPTGRQYLAASGGAFGAVLEFDTSGDEVVMRLYFDTEPLMLARIGS